MKADFLRYHIEDLLSFLFENKINGYLNIDKYPFVKEERV